MPWTDANRTPQQIARREAHLAVMRDRYANRRKRFVTKEETVTVTRRVRERVFAPRELAHAIRIAAKDAKARLGHNPVFVEALETAATYFDDM